MDKLKKTDPDFYSKISNLRRTKSGGKTFNDIEKAKEAQRKSVASRKTNNELREAKERAEAES